MTNYLSLIGTLIASAVALGIAVWNARRSDRHRREDAEAAEQQRRQDRMAVEQQRREEREAAVRAHQAEQLAKLLTLHATAGPPVFTPMMSPAPPSVSGQMRAILLTLPGHLATVLRIKLKLNYTVTGVPLDQASRARLHDDENDAGKKWLIFDRASAITSRGFEPRPEWIEAELTYDIEGLLGGDQDAVLAALKLNRPAP